MPVTDTKYDGLASQYNITSNEFVEYYDNVNDGYNNLVSGSPYVYPRSEQCYTQGVI